MNNKNYDLLWFVPNPNSQSIQWLLESVTESYYKVWQVLQGVTGINKFDTKVLQSMTVITKRDDTPLQNFYVPAAMI